MATYREAYEAHRAYYKRIINDSRNAPFSGSRERLHDLADVVKSLYSKIKKTDKEVPESALKLDLSVEYLMGALSKSRTKIIEF